MKYIYATDKFNQNLCSLFDVEYTPMEIYRIPVEKNISIMPSNIGIDIGVKGQDPWNKGKKTGSLSEDHKKALSLSAQEYTKTEEHRNNLAKALKGNQNGKKNTKPKSEEHKQKLKEAAIKQWAKREALNKE
jgi:hypothetical protein